MCGAPGVHSSKAFLEEEPTSRIALQTALEDLIVHQYVKLEGEGDEFFQVMEGSGMGQIASGDISDNTFLQLAEKEFAALNSVQDQHRIQKYIRYRDDILVIGEDPHLIGAFFRKIKALIKGVYVLELSEYSSTGISYLDVFVSKTSEISKGHLAWKPYFKPTSQHLPLAGDSGHAPPIHRSWPKAEILRMSKRSSSEIAFLCAKDHLCNRWQSGFLESSIVTGLSQLTQPLTVK